MTFPMQFSDAFINQRFGTITGTSAESQFPNVPAHIGLLRARSGNTSPMYLGSGNTGSAFQLGAGEWTPWFSVPTDNLSSFRQSSPSGASTYLDYWVQW